jgi:hypothetical protein
MTAESHSWRRLGAVLVEAGLLSDGDLADALDEQERSGELLGNILVARGLVSGAAVANALAEQYGGVLRSEHGIGTGLRESPTQDDSEPEAPPVSPTEPSTQALDAETDDGAHLVFVPTPNEYLLLQRLGPVPSSGDRLEVPEAQGRQLVVSKVASSPLPGDERRCAYLQEL